MLYAVHCPVCVAGVCCRCVLPLCVLCCMLRRVCLLSAVCCKLSNAHCLLSIVYCLVSVPRSTSTPHQVVVLPQRPPSYSGPAGPRR